MYKRYKKKQITKKRAYAVILLVTYITVVLFFTLLGRRSLESHRFGPDLVTYYTALFNGNTDIDIIELMLNVLMFVPIGLLACFAFKRYKLLLSIVVGFGVSVFIELFQLLLKSGYVSMTDIIHNTLGTFLGALLGVVIILIIRIVGMVRLKVAKR